MSLRPAQTFEVEVANAPPRVRTIDRRATIYALIIRVAQTLPAALVIYRLRSTPDFLDANAFSILFGTASLQCLWSFSIGICDICAFIVGHILLQNHQLITSWVLAVGDGVTFALMFGAACASATITMFIRFDTYQCPINNCTKFEDAVTMAFISCFFTLCSFIANLYSLTLLLHRHND